MFPLRKRFEPSPENAAAARAFVADAVADFDVDHHAMALLVSELASNAIRHARTAFEVSVAESGNGLRVAVSDESHTPVHVAKSDEGGFGLSIVDAVSDGWGLQPAPQGKTVWFSLPARANVPAPVDELGPDPGPAAAQRQPMYSIGAVSRLVGVEATTLRAWERRYGVVVPVRSASGQRLFSRDQVDQLRFAVAQIEGGMTAADAHRVLSQRQGSVTFVPPVPEASMLVLLAERDAYAADLAEYFLRTEGYDVRVALDSQDARQLLEAQRLDLALLELLLPGGSALQLCRELADRGVPVLAVSSLRMQDAAMQAGASAFLLKPFEPLQLVSTVRDLLGTSALGHAMTQKAGRAVARR